MLPDLIASFAYCKQSQLGGEEVLITMPTTSLYNHKVPFMDLK